MTRDLELISTEQARSLSDTNKLQKQRGEGLESQVRQIQASIGAAQNEARMVSHLIRFQVVSFLARLIF